MKKNILFLALTFGLLFLLASNQSTYAQATTKSGEAPASSVSKINYSEVNSLIDQVIVKKIMEVIQFIKKYLLIAWGFFVSLPPLIKIPIIIAFFPAFFGIIASHALGIYRNRKEWVKHPNYDLMYSYFMKSGALQRKKSYKDAHSLLRDHKWSWVSFAGLAYRLGNYVNKSSMLMFFLSFAYIPLLIFGIVEMIFRIVFGTIWLWVLNIMHRLLLLATKLISYLLIPIAFFIDKTIRNIQYCPQCYETFNLPEFVCPSCGRRHKQLIPGSCGVLFARCACNNVFLPTTSFTGRSRLASKCPACEEELATANAKHFSMVIVGGDNVGKTAFITAFSILYASKLKNKRNLTIEGKPESYFDELDEIYSSGNTVLDTESRTYSIVHSHGRTEKDNLVFYKTFGEYVMSDKYHRSPKYFGFCDGIILIIDPLCAQSVKKELSKDTSGVGSVVYSPDDTNEVVVQFIHQYNTICGFASGKMSDVPVVVLINKVDIDAVKSEIGWDAIRKLYNENPVVYYNNENNAKDQICREYMTKIGLINVLNNIDATFTNVSFFPVSTIGHKAEKGKAFSPIGVIEPVAWIAQKRHSRLASLLLSLKTN